VNVSELGLVSTSGKVVWSVSGPSRNLSLGNADIRFRNIAK